MQLQCTRYTLASISKFWLILTLAVIGGFKWMTIKRLPQPTRYITSATLSLRTIVRPPRKAVNAKTRRTINVCSLCPNPLTWSWRRKRLTADLNEAMDVEQRISMGREFHRAGRQWKNVYFRVLHQEERHKRVLFCESTTGTRCHSLSESAQNQNHKSHPRKQVATSKSYLIGNQTLSKQDNTS